MTRERVLILVMEPGRQARVVRHFPQLSGHTILYENWIRRKGILVPIRNPLAVHRQTRDTIMASAKAWTEKLPPAASSS